MIHTLEVKNFQSLKHVKVEFGQFTVFVGKSDSGKTALFRALNILISNMRGVDKYVTIGEKAFTISLTNDEWQITLERSKRVNMP